MCFFLCKTLGSLSVKFLCLQKNYSMCIITNEMTVWLILGMGLWSECKITLCPINIQEGRISVLLPRWQQSDGDVGVFTGNTACSRGGRNGFIFTPACFITSEAFLNRLMKGKVAEADGNFHRLPASVPPDSGNQTTASEINIPHLIILFPKSANVILPPIRCSSSFSYCCHVYLYYLSSFNFVCF